MMKKLYVVIENLFIFLSILGIIYVVLNYNSIYNHSKEVLFIQFFHTDTPLTQVEAEGTGATDDIIYLHDNSKEAQNSKDFTHFVGESVVEDLIGVIEPFKNHGKHINVDYERDKKRKEAKEEMQKQEETGKKESHEIDFFALSSPLSEEETAKYGKNSYIVIPKINVEAPIFYPSIEIADLEGEILKVLENGVAHRPETQMPYQKGNFFVLGHSSNFPWIRSKYNNVFAKIDLLNEGDEVYVFYEGRKYVYHLYQKDIVPDTDLSVYGYLPGHNLSIMTCYPIGSTQSRLIAKFKLKINDY